MLDRAARLPLERPHATLAAILLLTLLLAPSLLQVSFQTDVEAFLPNSEAASQHERVELLFGRESKVAQLYVIPTNGNNILTMEALLEIQELHRQAAQLEECAPQSQYLVSLIRHCVKKGPLWKQSALVIAPGMKFTQHWSSPKEATTRTIM